MIAISRPLKHFGRALVILAVAANVRAATTDLATEPLVVSSTTPPPSVPVRPNVFIMMDDSGSMGWEYMPDDANSFSGKYGFTSSQCNGIYYDPNIIYTPPVDSTGASYPNSTFASAWKDGYNTGSGSTNLSTSFSSGGSSAAAAFYYKYSGAQTTNALRDYYNTNSTFYKECNSSIGNAPGNGVFTKITVSSTSGPGTLDLNGDGAINASDKDERTNFANWYSYYRDRMNMMKTATGLAFKPIGSNYRVGFATMNNNGGADLLNLNTFDSAQKSSFYTMLYGASTGSSTPLPKALSNAGRLYAHKLPSNTLNGVTANDPVQYSCQQNFTILSTDGFWNSATNYNLSGGSVGQQDGSEPRPMYDGASQSSQTVTVTTTVERKQSVQPTTSVTPWTRTITSVSATQNCSTGGGASATCLQDNGSNSKNKVRTWCMVTTNNPGNASDCTSSFGTGTPKAYACRGQSNSTNIPDGGVGCVTDGGGQQWCIYPNGTAGTTSCTVVYSGNSLSVCKPPATINGYTVTTQTQNYSQTVTGTTTSVKDYTTVVTSTVVTTNGQSAPATTVTTGPTPSNVSSSTAVTTDTGAPSGGTSWTNGGTTSACSATPPAAGTSTPLAGTTTTTNNGTATVSTLSTTTTVGTPTTTSSTSGGTSNTLADVAEYYYVNDLRTSALGNATGALGTDVTANNVPSSGLDAASWQHMTTFTLGLGARGRMVFSPTYQTDTSGDFASVKNGSTANGSTICSWQASGTTCNWPTPDPSGTPENIDDLWHAAVNGRGTYFSATNPSTLATGLSGALSGVSARTGASAAATTSNPNVTSGDNFVFSSTFVTKDWYGQLVRQRIDLTTGRTLTTVDPITGQTIDLIDWSAQTKLDANASRTIYSYDSGASNGLIAFTAANFAANTNFSLGHISTLSQFCASGATCLSSADQTLAAGTNLVNYLRGDRTNEGVLTDPTKYYRQRVHVLGDIVSAEAIYVKGNRFDYADSGYSSSTSLHASRQGMVYAGSNDGMLHAFYSEDGAVGSGIVGGEEAWAYIPSIVLPNLYKLADKNYASNHQYLVDGTPTQGDICPTTPATACTGAQWKTILVAGLNDGGRGYYALDVTNPAAPKALWEFTDVNMGYTYGNPEITKLKDGTWVVLLTSGYNNVSPGDGQGHLYVVRARDGFLIRDITTAVGDTTTPSGLSRIIAQVVNNVSDNTVLRVYGGDVLGNLWRFDVNGDVGAAGYDAQLLATLRGPGGNVQPLTAKPEVGTVDNNVVVYVGTGRYLGSSDLTDTSAQTIYAIKDPLLTTSTPANAIYPNPRTFGGFVQQDLTTTTCPAGSPATICNTGQIVRTSTSKVVNFATNNGWFVDLPDSGERATNDPTLRLGTLGFTTNVPSTTSCEIGGSSFSYFFDYRSGAPVSTSTTGVVGIKLGNALATRPVYVRLPNNTVVQLIRLSEGTTLTTNVPIGAGAGGTRRISWRELITQ